VKKHILNLTLSIFLLVLILLVFVPYFTSDFLNLRQKKENEENYQKLLKEEETRKEAEKNYLTGKFDPSQREDFVLIPPQYVLGGNKMYLRKETLDAFLKMAERANEDKIDLKIASATRNFDYQKDIWNKKWFGIIIVDGEDLLKSIPDEQERFKKILEYNAIPGTSRHHWGTDIDINRVNPLYSGNERDNVEREKIYAWLSKNAFQFGFCQTYTPKGINRKIGYKEERWHWSYLPLSQNFTREYKKLIKDEDIKGFEGDEYVPSFDLINDYVLAINPDCL